MAKVHIDPKTVSLLKGCLQRKPRKRTTAKACKKKRGCLFAMSRSVMCGCEKTQGKETHQKDMRNMKRDLFAHGSQRQQRSKCAETNSIRCVVTDIGVVGKIRNSWS